MAERSLTIRIDFGTPRLNVWCPICLVPSGYEVDLLRITERGVSIFGRASRCTECGIDLRKIQPDLR